MPANKEISGLSKSIPLIDLTKGSEELKRNHSFRRQVNVFSLTPPSIKFTHRRRSLCSTSTTKASPAPRQGNHRYSTVFTIQLPHSVEKNPENPDSLKSDKQSNEFIEITAYASKLSGSTSFHRVDRSQFSLSNKQVIWDSSTSPLHVRCVKCIRNLVTRAVFPCGHLCLCSICGYNIFSSIKRCPVCNKTMSNLAVYSWLG